MTEVRAGKGLNIALWIAAALLAAAYGLFGVMKLVQPIDQLANMMTWVRTSPLWFVRGLGLAEILGAIGLILPTALRIVPKLTVAAALCIIIHQLIAVGFHLSRGEAKVIGLNVVLIALAAFVFWGRSTRGAIAPRT